MISKEEIKKLADLARIEIEDREVESLRGNMNAVLDYVKSIQEFHSDEANLKSNAKEELEINSLHNVMREDVNPTASETYSRELIAEFPDSENNYLKVKKIL
jgi:aspartyl-tRNA(Asn)/glutamyl-tRNA(Gln) amidotransferase subunit C